MNYKFMFMNKITNILKKAAPFLAVLVVLAGVLNFSSYDPYNELSSLTPSLVAASEEISLVGGLTIPTLTVPSLTSPTSLTTPQLSTPTLTTPALEPAPTLTVPELTVPTLTTPTLNTGSTSFTSCNITASASSVYAGDSVTLSWNTNGFSTITINGEAVTGNSGSRTYSNIQTTTTYTLVATSADGKSNCTSVVTVGCLPPVVIPAPTCVMTPATQTINSGDSVTLNWSTTNAASASLTDAGAVALNGSRNTGALNSSKTYTLTVVGNNGQTINCNSVITVRTTTTITPPVCPIQPKINRTIINFTGQKLVSNKTAPESYTNFVSAPIPAGVYDITLVSWDGYIGRQNVTQAYESYRVNLIANTTVVGTTGVISDLADRVIEDTNIEMVNSRYVLSTAISAVQARHAHFPNSTSANSLYPICMAFDKIPDEPEVKLPSCDAFGASPTTINKGDSSTLTWSTSNATRVTINNGIGEVAATGSVSVSPLVDTSYIMTVFGANDKKATCSVDLKVKDTPVVTVPKCESFTVTPTNLPVGGGVVTLNWTTSNANSVSISPTIGSVALNGSATTSVTANTNFVLTATDASGAKNTCQASVTVTPVTPTAITCDANVSFSANPTSIRRGQSATLTWSTTGVTGVSFDNGISATGLSGSVTVSPTSNTTYTLTATDGRTTISCPARVTIRTGGGGGTIVSPRCELSASKTKIKAGESVVLTWESDRADELVLRDLNTKVKLVDTKGLSSSAANRLMDGTITVSPKTKTKYELLVENGSQERYCTVEVDVDKDTVVVTQIRDQQPLVSGIALTQVPYTGFEAGPILTFLFYTLLLAWALYISYLLVIKRDVIGGVALAMASAKTDNRPSLIPEQIRPDVFVAKVTAPVAAVTVDAPLNLPVADAVIGYANLKAEEVVETQVDEMTMIENQAHAEKVLVSSEAVRHFMATTKPAERKEVLAAVISAAKAKYPSEDGWVVLNEGRMNELCVTCAANQAATAHTEFVPTVVPTGAGSLAEAIVTGNVVAAYEMIGSRPMFALADAAADLDSVYRVRRGHEAKASDLLLSETANLSDEALLKTIEALTGALDGTYTDEASAVKMAIMKAIKAVA
jgi:hypothetical protein